MDIIPINDAPVLSAIDEQSIAEDTIFSYTLNASDVDGDDLSYSASTDGNSSISIADNQLSVIPIENYNGSITVSVDVLDGNGGVDSNEFTLTVTPVNDAPVIALIEDASINEDSSFS